MKISKIKVENYRLLKEFEIDLEDQLSLIIGKNNCGKTSLLSILERFLLVEQNNFSFDDFNLLKQKELKEIIETGAFDEDFNFAIRLKIYINYFEEDNLANISSMMLNLNPEENVIVLNFEYSLDYENILLLRKEFGAYKATVPDDEEKDLIFYLKKYHSKYFNIHRKALEYNNESNFIELHDKREINRVINFKRIKAKRGVVNSDGTRKKSDKTLSRLSSDYYDRVSSIEDEEGTTKELRENLSLTDKKLTEVYETLFKKVVDKVKKFGGVKLEDSIIKIVSTLEEKNILRENTSVMYSQSDYSLPEDYNGLGYMNLIAMIFEIEVVVNDFKKKKSKVDKPSDINLFFIEEPEAHTHPQMQYIFIKNIKAILEEECNGDNDGITINLQTITSTHSSHITAESNFDDVKYFYKENQNSVIAKNLKALKEQYATEPKQYEFLKQYLTLNRAELFFADKTVLIEGDTERILIPTIMKKLDLETLEEDKENNILPLLSQNISIVEVGAYSQIFEKFIDFLGIKALVITDIDSVNADGNACRVSAGTGFSNSAIQFFFGEKTLQDIVDLNEEEKRFSKKEVDGEIKWVSDVEGKLSLVYQLEQDGYHSRSFEDSFIHINKNFINDNREYFRGLKNRAYFDDETKDDYDLADECIKKKTHFALDIIYHSNEDYSNWQIPSYIKNGLLWLKK